MKRHHDHNRAGNKVVMYAATIYIIITYEYYGYYY